MKTPLVASFVFIAAPSPVARAAPWVEDKVFFTDPETLPSSKVDAADLNDDGFLDLVFANGAGFDKGDDKSDVPQQAFLNENGMSLMDASSSIFGDTPYAGRAVKLRDVDYDGDNDILLGTTWETQSQLLLNDGGGNFTNVTDANLPQVKASVGDLEVGDVDQDGDLDIVLNNWGPAGAQTVATNSGGVTLLWNQMGIPGAFGGAGTGMFEDATLNQMPNIPVRWSWELEFVDVDNDFDLDLVISANAGDKASVLLFRNDGEGTFTDATAGNIPQGKNGLDVEPMDFNGDGYLDLLSVHDGVSGRNRLLINDKTGKFVDSTDILWPKSDNPPSYDTMAAFYDYDSNAKADFVVGAFQLFADRLIYESNGKFNANLSAFQEAKVSSGTFAIVLADLNLDRRLDLAMSQNENAFDKRVLIASEEIPVDTVAPFFSNIEPLGVINFPGNETIRVRCHDNKSPLMLHDFKQDEGFPYMETWAMEPADPDNMPGDISAPGQWYGEYMWRINYAVPDADMMWYRICAIDAAANKRCTPLMMIEEHGGTATESDDASATMSNSDTAVSASVTGSESMSAGTVTETMSDSDSFTDTSTESQAASDTKESMSISESMSGPTESDSMSDADSTPTESFTATMTNSESDTQVSADEIDDGGCFCNHGQRPTGGFAAMVVLVGWRRRRADGKRPQLAR